MYDFGIICKKRIWWKSKVVYICIHFIVYMKTDDIYKDIAEDAEARFDTSNCKLDKPLS